MDNKLKFQQLECYKLATDEQKEKLNKEQNFGQMPSENRLGLAEPHQYRGFCGHQHQLLCR